MTSKRLLDSDVGSGSKRIFHYADQEKVVHLEVVQDIGPHLERARRLRNDDGHKRRGIKNSHLHVATLPDVVVEKWLNEKRIPPNYMSREGVEAVMKILRSDPDDQYLKTVTVKI